MWKHYDGYGSGIISGIAWGADTVLVGIILSLGKFTANDQVIFLAPFISTFLHDFFSTIWMLIYMTLNKQIAPLIKSLNTPSVKYVVIASILGGPVGMTAYLLSVKYLGVSYTAIISALYPAVGAVLAAVFLKERLKGKGYIGLAISILGIAILGIGDKANIVSKVGFLFASLCVIGWGSESVICSYGMKDEELSPKQALQIRQFVSAVTYGFLIIPVVKGFTLTLEVIQSPIIAIILINALMGTISYVCYYTAIHKLGSVKAMGLNITYVVWAMIFDRFIIGTPIDMKMIICAIMVMVGSFIVATSPKHIPEDYKV